MCVREDNVTEFSKIFGNFISKWPLSAQTDSCQLSTKVFLIPQLDTCVWVNVCMFIFNKCQRDSFVSLSNFTRQTER
jgi:hypothetical protein